MLIGGFQKSSLIDFPEKISAIIFTQGCNFRCPYCHNPEIIEQNSATALAVAPILEFLNSRKNKLDGIVITGGEPTIQKELPELITKIKGEGFSIKLDTNGTNPKMISSLIDKKLIDYIAMDIKGPIEKYSQIVNKQVNTDNILESINVIKNSGIDHEFRTTVIKSQLCQNDFEEIGKTIAGSKRYYLQKFIPTKLLDESFFNETTYNDEEFAQIINILKKYINTIELR